MSDRIPDEYLELLHEFIDLCKAQPSYLHDESLKFFKDYLLSLGATIPAPAPEAKCPPSSSPPKNEETGSSASAKEVGSEENSEESEVEIDESGVIEPDNDDPLPEGKDDIEVTEDMLEESSAKRAEAMQALSDGNKEEAIRLLTESITSNPKSAIGYAKRAGILLSLNKPNAVIRDCNKALMLNPDQALAYKYRGRAQRLLGKWEEAAKDLSLACKLDYTDEANEWLKEVTPNVKKIQEHKRKYERKHLEKLQRERRAQYEKAKAANESKPQAEDIPKETDFSGLGGLGGFIPPGMEEVFSNPELMEIFNDPEVVSMMNENPQKLYSHPKIIAAMSKIKAKMGQKEEKSSESDDS